MFGDDKLEARLNKTVEVLNDTSKQLAELRDYTYKQVEQIEKNNQVYQKNFEALSKTDDELGKSIVKLFEMVKAAEAKADKLTQRVANLEQQVKKLSK